MAITNSSPSSIPKEFVNFETYIFEMELDEMHNTLVSTLSFIFKSCE